MPDGRHINIDDVLNIRPTFVIGSHARADLQLAGEGIAPSHAIITCLDGDYRISPLLPSNTVQVNGKAVKLPMQLSVGDVIRVGAVELSFAQAEGKAAPMKPVHVIMPAVLPTGYPKPAAQPLVAPISSTMAGTGEIYYPRQEQSGGPGIGALLSGLAVILIVGGIIGYGLFGAATPSVAAGDLTSQFAFKDGNVTIVMFDADW